MAYLPGSVTMITCSIPLAAHSSMPYWMLGLSSRGSISLGTARVTGRNRVPRPPTGITALRTCIAAQNVRDGRGHRGPPRGGRGRAADHAPRGRSGALRHAGDDRADGADLP